MECWRHFKHKSHRGDLSTFRFRNQVGTMWRIFSGLTRFARWHTEADPADGDATEIPARRAGPPLLRDASNCFKWKFQLKSFKSSCVALIEFSWNFQKMKLNMQMSRSLKNVESGASFVTETSTFYGLLKKNNHLIRFIWHLNDHKVPPGGLGVFFRPIRWDAERMGWPGE